MTQRPWKSQLDADLLAGRDRWSEHDVVPARDVEADDWVRLCPVAGELIFVKRGRRKPGADGIPRPRDVIVDRKLVTGADLVDDGLAPQILASERLVAALEQSEASGWSATELPHATPNPVAGRRLFVLEVEGSVGELVDTARGEYGVPIPPVTFDATHGSGDDVCWSPWFELDSPVLSQWRALLVRGHLVRELCRHGDDPELFVQPVTVLGAHARTGREAGRAQRREAPEHRPPPLSETLDAIAAGAATFGHALPAGAPSEFVTEALAQLGLAADAGLGMLLRRFDAPVLFRGALAFNFVGNGHFAALQFEVGDLVGDNQPDIRDATGVVAPEGVVLFARSHGGEMYWGIDRNDRVRGYSQPGHGYGPDAPFDAWLADMIADLEFAAQNDELESMLTG